MLANSKKEEKYIVICDDFVLRCSSLKQALATKEAITELGYCQLDHQVIPDDGRPTGSQFTGDQLGRVHDIVEA